MKIGSVKQESILRQFGIYFIVAAVIPFITFLYILAQLAPQARSEIYGVNLKLVITIAGLLSILGFVGRTAA